MATLCAIDVAKALPDWGLDAAPALLPLPAGGPLAQGAELPGPAVSLSVYTFGAPRTGNHASRGGACMYQQEPRECLNRVPVRGACPGHLIVRNRRRVQQLQHAAAMQAAPPSPPRSAAQLPCLVAPRLRRRLLATSTPTSRTAGP